MPGVFQDTIFAALVRAVLGPKYFSHIDEMDAPCVYEKTIHLPKSTATTTTLVTSLCDRDDPFNLHGHDPAVRDKPEAHPSDTDLESSGELPKPVKEPVKELVKEGTDSLLVTWYGPDDPEVCQGCQFVSHQTDFVFCEESTELVAAQEILGHVSSLLSDFFCLLRLCSLYCWDHRCCRAISCQLRHRDTWAYVIPTWVWSW